MSERLPGSFSLTGTVQNCFLGVYHTCSLPDELAALNLLHLDSPPACLSEGALALCYGKQGLALHFCGAKSPGPIYVDFVKGSNAHRRRYGGGKGQLIAKAVGIKGAYRPSIIDATTGLGQDAFVLATLGCQLTLLERSPIVYHLLKDGLQRASYQGDKVLQTIIQRMTLHHCSALDYLQTMSDASPDVIYLDPMFPERHKSASVNKSMQALQQLVGGDDDAGHLLQLALSTVRCRVVVKRPRKAPSINEQYLDLQLPQPSVVLSGKSCRYDIYALRSMP